MPCEKNFLFGLNGYAVLSVLRSARPQRHAHTAPHSRRTSSRPADPPHHPHTRQTRSSCCPPSCTTPSQLDTASTPTSSTPSHCTPASHAIPHLYPIITSTCTTAHQHASHLHTHTSHSAQDHQHTQHHTPPPHALTLPTALSACCPFPFLPLSVNVPQMANQNNSTRSRRRSACSFTCTSCCGLVCDSLVCSEFIWTIPVFRRLLLPLAP